MNFKELLAKSRPKETIAAHTENVLESYERLKRFCPDINAKCAEFNDYVKMILMYHDYGKVNPAFQDMILRSLKEKPRYTGNFQDIPHEWISAAFINKDDRKKLKSYSRDELNFVSLAKFCIAYHHSRGNLEPSKEDIEKVLKWINERSEEWEIPYLSFADADVKRFKEAVDSPENFNKYFPYRVLFKGILHKCDYAASAHIEPEKPYNGNYRTDFERWLAGQGWELRDFQKQARGWSDKSVVLVASTGMGKTECSMNWIDGHKAFYLLGIRTAVNAMFNRFRETFDAEKVKNDPEDLDDVPGDFGNVALLHGETGYLLADESEDNEDYFEKYSMAKQMTYPVTVATADQLVTAAFKYNGFELVYFTASYSHIVVDEIQSFAPESIAAIVIFLKEIHRLGGRFMLMTATLPEFVKREFEELQGEVVYPDPQFTPQKRHRVKLLDHEINDPSVTDRILSAYREGKKVLVICNTVKRAQEMYAALKDCGPKLLHARFIQNDKRNKEKKIICDASLKNGKPIKLEPVIWISTQIVEASLDIDFDVLFTEGASIDSLLQRFGRCWRTREYTGTNANVFITRPSPWTKLIYDPEIVTRTMDILRLYDEKLLGEDDKQAIINQVYEQQFLTRTKYWKHYKHYKDLLSLGFRAKNRAEAQEMFRKIGFQYSLVPGDIYSANRQEIDECIRIIDKKGVDAVLKAKAKSKLTGYTMPLRNHSKLERFVKKFDSDYCRKHGIVRSIGGSYDADRGWSIDYTDTKDEEMDNLI